MRTCGKLLTPWESNRSSSNIIDWSFNAFPAFRPMVFHFAQAKQKWKNYRHQGRLTFLAPTHQTPSRRIASLRHSRVWLKCEPARRLISGRLDFSKPKVISLPLIWTVLFPPDFLNYRFFKPTFISHGCSKTLDFSVFQSYSYSSSGSGAPRMTIGCASIVIAFFLLVTGGILVTVYKHKNEQKGKFYF